MRYQVPQFIEVEDKIFGPLTLKQFIYIVGGAGLSFIIYVLIGNLLLSFIPMAIVMGISLALAFFKVYNHFPLITIAEHAFKYWFGSKLYIWKKEEKPRAKDAQSAIRDAKSYAGITVPKISDSKLKELTWSLDIKESMYSNRNQK
ncbi:MAG: PrgI family protein [Candidatus Paceibacterota bacterium]|jgi:hypothetical protein